MCQYSKASILYVHFYLQNLSTMNILDPIFLSHVVSMIFASDLPKILVFSSKWP